MTINSESFFRKVTSRDKALDRRERRIKIREDRLFNKQQSMLNSGSIDPQPFFEQGREAGIQEGIQLGLQQAAVAAPDNTRQDGGPIEKGKTYLVGEKGPELVTSNENAFVMSNDEISVISSPLNRERVIIQPVNIITTRTVAQPVPSPFPVPTPFPVFVSEKENKSIAHRL